MNALYSGTLSGALRALCSDAFPIWNNHMEEVEAQFGAQCSALTAAAGVEIGDRVVPLVVFTSDRILLFDLLEGDHPAAACAVGDLLALCRRPLVNFHRASEDKKILSFVLLANSKKEDYVSLDTQFFALSNLGRRLRLMQLAPDGGLDAWLSCPFREGESVLIEQIAESRDRWVTFVLDGWLKDAKKEMQRLHHLGFRGYLTTQYANAKTYCRTRYDGRSGRYGFVTSSQSENMFLYGAPKGVRNVSRIPRPEDEGWEERWFDPTAPDRSESFARAGLETMFEGGRTLECSVLGWGDDVHWSGRWKSRFAPFTGMSFGRGPDRPKRTEIPDGRMIRSAVNRRRAAYDTLLHIGSEAMIVFVDKNPYIYLDHTYNALLRAGLKKSF